jgi:dienelactone hydrolase
MQQLNWTENAAVVDNVSTRGFTLARNGQNIPGMLWQPAAPSGRRPLILMGHGGSGHKRNARMAMLGKLFAGEYGWSAAAIDGPVHGERGPVTEPGHPLYRQMWQRPDVVEQMIADWRVTLDALTRLDTIDAARVGYWGVSMGTMFGLPYVASDARVKVAVLGKAGMSGSSVQRSGVDKYFRQYAAQMRVPVLFTMQWDDERFERAGQITLFDMLGATDKRLHAYPGLHSDNGPESFAVQAAFLARYLGDAGGKGDKA